MKIYILHIVLFFCITQQLYSQDDGVVAFNIPSRNSLKFNRHFINPTFSFVREQNKYISFNNKREWAQFDNAPQTYLFSYSGRFRENIGAGVTLFQQDYGVLTTFGGVLNFAYNAVLDRESNLTFGLNLGFYKSGINEGNVITNSPEPSLENFPSNSIITINPGINYGTEFLDFGVSINNLVSYNLASSKMIEDDPEQGFQAYIMYTGYLNSRGFFDESRFSSLIRSEFQKDQTVISGMVMLMVPKGFWAQAGYNSLYTLSAGIGLNITTQIAIEYNYGKGVGGFSAFGNAHDITLAYKFENRNRYAYSGDDDEEGLLMSTTKKRKSNVNRRRSSKSTSSKKKKPVVTKNNNVNSDKVAEEKQVKLAEATRVKAEQEEQARIAESARIKAEAEAQAKLEAAARVKVEQEEQARIAESARIKAEAEAQTKLAEAARVKVEQEEQARIAESARIKAEAEAQVKLEVAARVKAEQEEQARIAESARIKAEAEAQTKLEAATRLKAEQEEQARIAEVARIKAEAEAQTKSAEAARVKVEQEEQARIAEVARIKAEAEAQAKLEAAVRVKAEQEEQARIVESANAKAEEEAKINEILLDEVLIKFKKSTESSKNTQQKLLNKLSEKVAAKQQDLNDLIKENDLSEKGIFSAPKAFKSVSAENNAIEALKLEIDNSIELRNTKITEIESLYKERLKKVKSKDDLVNIEYLNVIKALKIEQLQAKNIKKNLVSTLEDIKVATDFERRRRIKRAAYDNENDRYNKDRATLERIKKFTDLSTEPLTKQDFNHGEELSNIQIVKDVNNVEEGYYLVVAVHIDVSKRDEFLKKAVAAGENNINFFFDVNTSKYYIYYEKFDNIGQAKSSLDTNKGSKPYNSKMSMVKIEN
ncbi:MAG: PorP/SprF family type IX secretion system membrane protein [Algibacter sp.]|uniref:PorP/SprF family type IX secretion system membrane protein n=1 Tax=Algibacter sp. TaxID=1872428 RepID=UPI002606C919|nr:PorP/SprF family type IX secretion system membrane protein [Algibacter sp.]MDG2177372.1 PorP/SprF family type IX secretion system membrane protein [Algibacter sp.]